MSTSQGSGHGLFDLQEPDPPKRAPAATAPLAVRMRPRSLDEVVGQAHLLRPGGPLRRLVEGGAAASVLLHGPPGTGKTTLAQLLAAPAGDGHSGNRHFVALSALSSDRKSTRLNSSHLVISYAVFCLKK